MAGVQKDIDKLIRRLRSMGLTVVLGRRGHWKVYRGPRLLTTLPATGSDQKSLLAARTILRHRGVRL